MMTLASALPNTSSVVQNTGTQYLSREFKITSDAAQKASFEDLVYDLQKIFHRCKNEANRLNTAQQILTTLGVIASKQGASEEQAHFAKIKEIALSALTPQGQTDDKISRARYFQDKLIEILYAKKLLTSYGIIGHTGTSLVESQHKFLEAFELSHTSDKNSEDYTYRRPVDNLSSIALSVILRLACLCTYERGPKYKSLTREELLEIKSFSEHESDEVKAIVQDYTLARKKTAAHKLYQEATHNTGELLRKGLKLKLIFSINDHWQTSKTLSAYYPAFDKYVNYLNATDSLEVQVISIKNIYEEHLIQLPAVHFAYRYFYSELNEVCDLFSNRSSGLKYKKAYEGYEGNALPAPEEFQSSVAVFPEAILPVAVEEETAAPSQMQPVSSKQSRPSKSKKKPSPQKPVPPPQQIKSEGSQISSTASTCSSTTNAVQEQVTVTLEKDTLPFSELVYDPRVSSWFTNPEDCLALPSYTNLSEETKKVALYKHAFPIALDELLGTAFCVQGTHQNNKQNQVDILYSVPGEIEFVNGKKVRGLFQYCFGEKNKICYHRYFKEMSISDLLKLDQYSKAFEEAEFPPLSSQAASTTLAKKNVDQKLVFEPHLNTYAVTDKAKGLTFRAFRIRTLT